MHSSGPKADSPLTKIPRVNMVKGDVDDVQRVKELCKDVQFVVCTAGSIRYETKHWPLVVDNLLENTNDTKPLSCLLRQYLRLRTVQEQALLPPRQ